MQGDRPEGVYVSRPTDDSGVPARHMPVLIERVNGDGSVTSISIAADEVKSLIKQLEEFNA